MDYPEAVVAFLHTRDDDLDAGFSLGYKHEAWAQGSEADAVTYLMHRDRQTEMEDALRKMLGTSLDAERKINVDRLSEKKVHWVWLDSPEILFYTDSTSIVRNIWRRLCSCANRLRRKYTKTCGP